MPETCAVPDCSDPPDCSYIGIDLNEQLWAVQLCGEHFHLAIATTGMTDEEACDWARKNRPGGHEPS